LSAGLRENPDRAESEQALEEQVGLLERYARLAPMNFAHKLALVQAEVHCARREVLPAMQAYERAAQGAMENGYLNEAGLAHALAAEYHRDLGLHQAALHNAERAAELWQSWGADALVENLRERWPELSMPADSTREATERSDFSHAVMDLSTVAKASQALAGEIVLPRLLTKMMHVVIENAGATRGCLILKKEEQWVIEAAGDVDKTEVEVLQSVDVEAQENVSTGIVNYVARSEKILLLHDAVNEGEFTNDPAILSRRTRSVLCFPLINQEKVSGILYLENNLAIGAFTSERVELLQLLSSQMAMALDNARLYSDLEASEARFRSLVENANETIVVAQDETVKYGNPQVSKLTGYTPEELGSRDFVELIHPEDREIVLGEYKTRLSGERPASSYSIRVITKDGQEKHVLVSSALIDWEGKPATLTMLTDITDRKRAEEQMNQLRSELIHTARTSTMGEMTAALAHELNHPLGSILNNAYAARRFLEQDDPDLDEIRDIINDIISEDRRANEVMQKVRNLMKKTEVGLAPVKINSIIEEVLKLTHSELIIENVSLSKQLEKDLPQVTGERIQLQQVFINLIMNAVDAMKESKTKELHVSTARHDADNVVVCIRDTGAGFTDEEQGKLFKPFFTTKEEGMGMGLSVTKTIIKSHGGEIWAENNEEAGASFLITLPVYNEGSHE
jgi:PAS domain S-box-containing protein